MTATLRCAFAPSEVRAVTLIEEDLGALAHRGADIPLSFGPFEILSLRLLHSGAR